jgi:hypothetical protein
LFYKAKFEDFALGYASFSRRFTMQYTTKEKWLNEEIAKDLS